MPTPSKASGAYNHKYINNIFKSLLKLADKNGVSLKKKHLVICCTTMPGYVKELQKLLTEINYTATYNPEFIAQGTIIRDMMNPDMVLIGETDTEVGDELEKIYKNICKNKPSFHRISPTAAEVTKIGLNCFVTNKIAFANSLGDICISLGEEPDGVLEAIGSDSRVGNKYFRYGDGFGGPCFPRDNRALGTFSYKIGQDFLFSPATDEMNKKHLQNQIKMFCKKNTDKNKEVEIKSVSYKPESNIIEESQRLLFASELVDEGYKVKIIDSEKVIDNVKTQYKDKFNYEIKE